MGGVLEAYIANHSDVTGVTATAGVITAITMASSAKFKKYQFAKNTGSLSSAYAISSENGNNYVESTLNLVFNRMETAKRIEITALAQSDLAVIVKDANGKFWYLGYDEPVTASTGGGDTGTARADRNGYNITLIDTSHELPMEVDEDIIEDIVA